MKYIKILVLAEILLGLLSLLLSGDFTQKLPTQLLDYILEYKTEPLDIFWLIPLLLVVVSHLVAIAGILLDKQWAKPLYIFTAIIPLVAAFFSGHVVAHELIAAFDKANTFVIGMAVALLLVAKTET